MHPDKCIPQSELENIAGFVSHHLMKQQSATHQIVVDDHLPHSEPFNTCSGQDLQLDETEGIKQEISIFLKNWGFQIMIFVTWVFQVCYLKLMYKN